ncbi:hybrid sensor histidine kinase/response regulator [Leptolyngbya sp. AN02str]|uniref:hybrid sensor histidine kinase/response regulator n=1 Tax=Leptolyngbya sp. AN02str TaxID=3423363 RepID=UPI003D322E19
MNTEADLSAAVLIVAASAPTQDVLIQASQMESAQPILVTTEVGAIASLATQSPALIVVGSHLEDTSGVACCRRLWEQGISEAIPVLLVLNEATSSAVDAAFDAGVTDVLLSPLHPRLVAARLSAYLTAQHLQHQLHEQTQHLQEVQHSLQLMLHAISHDLRNPVLGMQMVLQNLLQGIGCCAHATGEQILVSRSFVERMVEGGDRHLSLIEALLDVYEGNARPMPLKLEPLALHDVIPHTVHQLQSLLDKNQASLVVDVASDLPTVMADAVQIERVFEHLIGNALKHNPPGVHIVLAAVVDGSVIRCSVQDNGIGIPADQRSQLFSLFERGANTGHTHGLGLGLYLCQQIVRAHGGEIGVMSTPVSGAQFWFTLPLKSIAA